MKNHPVINNGTIQAKVGERLTIETKSCLPYIGQLSFPKEFFKLHSHKKIPAKRFGGIPKDKYIIETLATGQFDVEYQRFDPRDPENTLDNLVKMYNADIYHIKVTSD